MQTFLHFNDPAVQASIIGAVGTLVASTIAAVCAAIIGKHIANRKRLQEKLRIAQSDIAFLLEVEQLHCEIHKKQGGSSHKNLVREDAKKRGLEWSGKFTPGRVSYNEGPGRRFSASS
ncbi:hypothetical protein [Ralstonia pseudosolanacearum]|uniref:hypothetical protein n=1 Tax=Ralstonia pseudosolanacearum TaxID=1310165 RepID=UPI003CF4DFBF